MTWYCNETLPANKETKKEELVTGEEMSRSTKLVIAVVFLVMLVVMLASIALSMIIIRMARERLRQTNAVWHNRNIMETIAAFFLATDSVVFDVNSSVGGLQRKDLKAEDQITTGKDSSCWRSIGATASTSGVSYRGPGDPSITMDEPHTSGHQEDPSSHSFKDSSRAGGLQPLECPIPECKRDICVPTNVCPPRPSTSQQTTMSHSVGEANKSPAQGEAPAGGQQGDASQFKRAQPVECVVKCKTDLCLPAEICQTRPATPVKEVCDESKCSGTALRSCEADGKIECLRTQATGDATQADRSTSTTESKKEYSEEGKKGDTLEGHGELNKSGKFTETQEELLCGEGGCNLGDPKDCRCEESTSTIT